MTIWEARTRQPGTPLGTRALTGGGGMLYFCRNFLAESIGFCWLWAPLNNCWLIRKTAYLDQSRAKATDQKRCQGEKMVSASQVIYVLISTDTFFPVGWQLQHFPQSPVLYTQKDSYDVPPNFAKDRVRAHSYTLTTVHTQVHMSHFPPFF